MKSKSRYDLRSVCYLVVVSSTYVRDNYDRWSVGQSILVSSPKIKVMLRQTVSRPVYIDIKLHLVPKTRVFLLSDSFWFHVGRPVWTEDGSVVYNCFWSSTVQSFSGPSPTGHIPYFTVSDLRLPKPWGTGPPIYIPQEQGGPVIPQALGSLFVAYDSQSYNAGIRTSFHTVWGEGGD
jgi:hypothetical protein